MRLGVDVSEHQAGFIFPDGLDFAVLRTTDGTYRDHAFAELYAGAHAAGLTISAYHYLRAPSEGTTVAEQVEAALSVLGDIRVPMWLDVESPAGLSLDDVTAAAEHFTAAGVDIAGVYTTTRYWRLHMGLARVGQFGGLWLAEWRENPRVELGVQDVVSSAGAWPTPLGMPTPVMWQFTSRGLLDGVDVDLNLAR